MSDPKTPVDNPYLANMLKLAEMNIQFWQALAEKQKENHQPFISEEALRVMTEATKALMEKPEALLERQIELYTDYMKIWGNVLGRYLGEKNAPLYAPDPKDKRFQDPAWTENAIFDFIKQSYLITAKSLQGLVGDVKGLDVKSTRQFDFYLRQYIDAMSPSNFALTNPKVICETLETKGENLVKGFQKLLTDVKRSKDFLQVSTTDFAAFQLGKNLACTPGKVIYENDLMQLIQYAPVTKQTFERPLLIIPAWINKYYILDLSPENSFVKWAVEQGYTVFMISWVNPTKKQATKTFGDYLKEGPLAALDAITQATGAQKVTAMGYCLGGTLLSSALAYMQAKGDDRIAAATLLTTMVDFSDAGELQTLVTESMMESLEKRMQETGYLDGTEMATTFSMLRANDLIWSFVVNNYLLGKNPFPFDILYWNNDSTRLPAATHSFYLRKTYLENVLAKPKGIKLLNVDIDVSKVQVPCYMLSTREDHIAPWKTTYTTTQLFKGKNTFVLAASGHVAGVINPPAKKKYGYWLNPKTPASADAWLEAATEQQGSWWEHWQQWNSAFSGKKIAAPFPGSGKLHPTENAPGSYVKEK